VKRHPRRGGSVAIPAIRGVRLLPRVDRAGRVSQPPSRAAEPVDGTIPPSTAEWRSLGDDVWAVGCSTATELFFGDVPPDVAAWACDRLRPQAYRVMNEPSPLQAWPAVDMRSIVCRADRAMNPDWLRAASLERLGVKAIEIDGGHSPFLSRPAELAAILDEIAREEP
jgi:pimeloyl-ACP methyl ester carboxylesterase